MCMYFGFSRLVNWSKRVIGPGIKGAERRTNELIESLGLTSCRDVKIGRPLQRGISGGQAKRVNIGVELVNNPPIIFLDEPTSGLVSLLCIIFSIFWNIGTTLAHSFYITYQLIHDSCISGRFVHASLSLWSYIFTYSFLCDKYLK